MTNSTARPGLTGRLMPSLGAAAVAGLAGLAVAPAALAAEAGHAEPPINTDRSDF